MSKYRTIVADPPWTITTGPLRSGVGEGFVGGDGRSHPLPYPTLRDTEIFNFFQRCFPSPFNKDSDGIAEPDAALYIWTTNGYLPFVLQMLKPLGFKYSTTLVWAKNPMGSGLGGCWGISTEFIVYARRGSPVEHFKHTGSWFNWKRPYDERGKPKHSAKPEQFYDLLERMHDGPRLDMFARRDRLGWDTFGNEALNHVEISA